MSNSLCWHDIASIATSIILTRYRVDMVYLYCYHFFNVDLYRRHHTDIANVKDILNMYIVFTTITSWTYRYFKVSRLRRCLHDIEFSSSFVLLYCLLYTETVEVDIAMSTSTTFCFPFFITKELVFLKIIYNFEVALQVTKRQYYLILLMPISWFVY